jgi:hypothetical protein
VTLDKIDYQKFKLFHLSILFRTGVSTKPAFSQVVLGSHEEEIRRMLWNDDPGDDTHYVILANAITDESSKIKYDLVTGPHNELLPGGYNSYGFCFAGCEWYYVVDKQSTNCFFDFQLKSNGTMKLTAINWRKFLNW